MSIERPESGLRVTDIFMNRVSNRYTLRLTFVEKIVVRIKHSTLIACVVVDYVIILFCFMIYCCDNGQ